MRVEYLQNYNSHTRPKGGVGAALGRLLGFGSTLEYTRRILFSADPAPHTLFCTLMRRNKYRGGTLKLSPLENERARERPAIDVFRQSGAYRILKNIGRNRTAVFTGTNDVLVKTLLPSFEHPELTKLPRRASLESPNHLRKTRLWRLPGQQEMAVVRHETVRVNLE